jgi:flagellar motor component MotA
MDNETLFFIIGPVLAASAVLVSFIGLRSEKFPGRFAPLVLLYFVIVVGGATTFAVLHSKDEESHKEQASGLPHATQEAEEAESK